MRTRTATSSVTRTRHGRRVQSHASYGAHEIDLVRCMCVSWRESKCFYISLFQGTWHTLWPLPCSSQDVSAGMQRARGRATGGCQLTAHSHVDKGRFALPPPPHQMERPKTVTMQYMVLFSHRSVALPSVVLSQKQEVAVCSPAPFFCISTAVTMYLNGLLSSLSFLMLFSMHCGRRKKGNSAGTCCQWPGRGSAQPLPWEFWGRNERAGCCVRGRCAPSRSTA